MEDIEIQNYNRNAGSVFTHRIKVQHVKMAIFEVFSENLILREIL